MGNGQSAQLRFLLGIICSFMSQSVIDELKKIRMLFYKCERGRDNER